MINLKIPQAYETDRAEASLSTLSFQSNICPERHVWIEVDATGISIDLEDWTIENEWDNAIARTEVKSYEEAIEILQIWLSGANMEDFYTNINKDYDSFIKMRVASVTAS